MREDIIDYYKRCFTGPDPTPNQVVSSDVVLDPELVKQGVEYLKNPLIHTEEHDKLFEEVYRDDIMFSDSVRDPARIPRILEKLCKLWVLCPDFRFGQFIQNIEQIFGAHVSFYHEDNTFEKELDSALINLDVRMESPEFYVNFCKHENTEFKKSSDGYQDTYCQDCGKMLKAAL